MPAAKGLDPESPGIILYDVSTTKQTILFTMSAVDGAAPRLGDRVRFYSLLDFFFKFCPGTCERTLLAIIVAIKFCCHRLVSTKILKESYFVNACGLKVLVCVNLRTSSPNVTTCNWSINLWMVLRAYSQTYCVKCHALVLELSHKVLVLTVC